jgi:hypothetical protein
MAAVVVNPLNFSNFSKTFILFAIVSFSLGLLLSVVYQFFREGSSNFFLFFVAFVIVLIYLYFIISKLFRNLIYNF